MMIEANGININYELSGKEQAPVVVLSHSLACSLVMWWPQLELLEAHFRVLRYDTRGHGLSDAPAGPYTLKQLVDDAIAMLDALKIDQVHWIGLSMGGMIGQGLTLSRPERLKTLVLADTAAIIPAEAQPVWQERIDAARNGGMQAVAESTLERWFTPNYLKNNLPETDRIRQLILATPLDGYIGCSEAIRRLNYLERLNTLDITTLIMVGAEDPGTPVAASEAMHAQIKNSELVVIPQAAHLSNIEQAAVFNDQLMAFLAGRG
ncbi:MAG: 3-oxoadipate enol-lactonase [Desulfobacterales bacterium]|jgi:3-oxoadipate enol-lactonase|nr:3-oxoadipate enol-lactonase [Deltaproteobacteria bacterium]